MKEFKVYMEAEAIKNKFPNYLQIKIESESDLDTLKKAMPEKDYKEYKNSTKEGTIKFPFVLFPAKDSKTWGWNDSMNRVGTKMSVQDFIEKYAEDFI